MNIRTVHKCTYIPQFVSPTLQSGREFKKLRQKNMSDNRRYILTMKYG